MFKIHNGYVLCYIIVNFFYKEQQTTGYVQDV